MRKQHILVTGAAGYIGSVLVPKLLGDGFEVTALDTYRRGDPVLAACASHADFLPVKGDVRDEALMKSLIVMADIIIPLAGLVGAPLCKQDPVNARTINTDAIIAMMKYVGAHQKVILPTTNSGYGLGQGDIHCTEETPLNPISLYGTSKMEAERAVLDKGNGVSLRLATVFGASPRMRLDLLVNDFTWRAVTDRAVMIFEGHFKRNYIHIRDVAKAFLHVIEKYGAMKGQAYNVGLSDANLSKVELCERIKKQVPNFVFLEAPIGEDPDKRNYIVSNAKIEKTEYRPDWSIDAGIGELIKCYTMINNQRFGNV